MATSEVTSTSAGRARQSGGYAAGIVRRWALILLFAAIGGGLALIQIARTPTAYVATAQVFATTAQVKDASGLFSGNEFVQSRVQSYVSVVNSPTIINDVRASLHLAQNEKQLAGKVSASAPLNQTLMNVHVRDASATRAARIANAVASRFIQFVRQIETVTTATATDPSATVIKLTIIHPAQEPSSPVAPRKALLLLIGFLGGLALGLIVAIVLERMNTRTRTALDVDDITSAPLVGVIPSSRRTAAHPNAFDAETSNARSDPFRLLRANLLLFLDSEQSSRVIAVTSPVGGEGKTTVAVNLAASLAEIGLSGCLVESDVRKPMLARMLGLTGAVGLVDVLEGTAQIEQAIQSTEAGFAVVVAGAASANPGKLLRPDHLRAIFADLSDRFDYVIIDALPLLRFAGGVEVASVADASVVVVKASATNRISLRRSLESLDRAGSIAAVVLNRASDVGWQSRH